MILSTPDALTTSLGKDRYNLQPCGRISSVSVEKLRPVCSKFFNRGGDSGNATLRGLAGGPWPHSGSRTSRRGGPASYAGLRPAIRTGPDGAASPSAHGGDRSGGRSRSGTRRRA